MKHSREAIFSKRGRYGGTFLHPILALDFLTYLEPRIKMDIYKIALESNPNLVGELYEKAINLEKIPTDGARFVYIINEVGTNRYKIGITKDLNKRLQRHKTSNAGELQYIIYVEANNASEIEYNLKSIYHSYNIRGEWYIFTKEVLFEIITRYFSDENLK